MKRACWFLIDVTIKVRNRLHTACKFLFLPDYDCVNKLAIDRHRMQATLVN
jgi:hypothetical protein